MIRIGFITGIVHDEDRWGRELPTFMVQGHSGYVDKKFWEEIKEFQNHSIAQEVAQLCFETGQSYHAILDGDIDLPITKRLVAKAHGQLWQFNALEKLNSDSCIRFVAILGEQTLKRWTLIDSIRFKYLQWKCKRMNKKVYERNSKTVS